MQLLSVRVSPTFATVADAPDTQSGSWIVPKLEEKHKNRHGCSGSPISVDSQRHLLGRLGSRSRTRFSHRWLWWRHVDATIHHTARMHSASRLQESNKCTFHLKFCTGWAEVLVSQCPLSLDSHEPSSSPDCIAVGATALRKAWLSIPWTQVSSDCSKIFSMCIASC
jgi:hypothetical protein